MFDSLSNRLADVFDRLRGRGALAEDDVAAAMREIRVALLEADVALPVVRDFIDRGAREGGRAGGAALGHAGADGGQDRPRPSGRDARRHRAAGRGQSGRARSQRRAAGRDHDGRAAGLGQDHDRGQDRAAPQESRAQEGADGLARRAAPGGAGAARRSSAARSASPTLPIVPGERPVAIARRALESGAARRLRRRACSTPPAGSTSTRS